MGQRAEAVYFIRFNFILESPPHLIGKENKPQIYWEKQGEEYLLSTCDGLVRLTNFFTFNLHSNLVR